MPFRYTRPCRGIAGVYRVRLSGRHFYIGSTCCFQARWATHLRRLRKGVHKNPFMQSVFNKYGVFEPEVLCVKPDREKRIALEQHFLDLHFSAEGCVNIQQRAEVPPMLGRKHSAESREKMSQARRGVPLSKAHKRSCSDSQKERHARDGVSETTRRKLSKALRGKKRPDIAARNKAAVGWRHTEEAKAKISAASQTGGFKGKRHSDKTRAKISETLTGRKPSKETLRKRSISLKKAWAARKARLNVKVTP